MTKIADIPLDDLRADLEERRRLRDMLSMFTYEVIAHRYGLTKAEPMRWAVQWGLDDASALKKELS